MTAAKDAVNVAANDAVGVGEMSGDPNRPRSCFCSFASFFSRSEGV